MSDELDKPRSAGWLAKRWGCSVDALRRTRERNQPPSYSKMPGGHARYRLRDVIEVELSGQHSFRDLPSILQAIAAIDGLGAEQRAAIEAKVREVFATH